MTSPGSCTADGLRHRASAADDPTSRHAARTVSIISAPGALSGGACVAFELCGDLWRQR